MLSKLSPVCKACPFRETCDHKMMVGCGQLAIPTASETMSDITQPILRETMTIMVNNVPTIVYKDDIEKEIYKEFYRGLGLHFGA